MKEAQELRPGNCVKLNNDLYIVEKNTYSKGTYNPSTSKIKMRSLTTGGVIDTVYKAADKFEVIVLDRRKMQYLYTDGEMYTFMDEETYEQMELNKTDLGDALSYLMEQMVIDIVLYGEKAVGVELPRHVDTEITYTEPAVKGDTGGKVLKAATIATGKEIQVPLYCNIGDKIRIDTTTDEFVSRAQ